MKKVYLLYVVVPILLLILAGCGRSLLPETQMSDELIRYMATAYNRGIENSFDQLKAIADDDSYYYDDNVLKYFKYFSGEIALNSLSIDSLKLVSKATDTSDSRIREYIVSALKSFLNSTSSSSFIDQYDEKIPVNSSIVSDFDGFNPDIITSYEKRKSLVDRVYELLKKDYDSYGLFRSNFEDFYPGEELSDDELRTFSEFIVDIAYTYTSSGLSFRRLQPTNSSSYPDIVELSQIPVELLLAIAYQESRFFPGSYRAEIKDGNIYSLSFGMSHILIDSDNIEISSNYSDIGNNKKESYTFELISYYYLGNSSPDTEDIFTDVDLLMVRGAFLYSTIYLDMIYKKFSPFFEGENYGY